VPGTSASVATETLLPWRALLGRGQRVTRGGELAGDRLPLARLARTAGRVYLLQLGRESGDLVAEVLDLHGGRLLRGIVLPIHEGLGVGVRDLLRALGFAVERLDVDQARAREDLEADLVLQLGHGRRRVERIARVPRDAGAIEQLGVAAREDLVELDRARAGADRPVLTDEEGRGRLVLLGQERDHDQPGHEGSEEYGHDGPSLPVEEEVPELYERHASHSSLYRQARSQPLEVKDPHGLLLK
jgi:hypothetical protein